MQTQKAFLEAEAYDGPSHPDLLLALHRPRLRPDPRSRSAEGRGAVRLLAAVPVQSGAGQAGQEPAATRFARADPAARQVHLQRDPLLHAAAEPARGTPRRSTTGRRETSTAAGSCTSTWPRMPGDGGAMAAADAQPAPAATRRKSSNGPHDEISRTHPEEPAGGFGVSALGGPRRRSRRWSRPARRRSSCTRCSRSRSNSKARQLDRSLSTGESYAESALLLPGPGQLPDRPGNLSGEPRQGQGGGADPDHRQPERRFGRRLDPLREEDAGSRRGRASSSTSTPFPTDPKVTAAEIEQTYCDLVRDVKASVQIPVAVKLGPYFSAMVNMASQAGPGRRRRPGALQPLLPARFRPRSAGGRSQPATQHLLRTAAAAALGGDSLRQGAAGPGHHRRRPHLLRRAEGDDGGRAGGHDDLGASQARHRVHRRPCWASCRPGWKSTNTNPSSRCRAR